VGYQILSWLSGTRRCRPKDVDHRRQCARTTHSARRVPACCPGLRRHTGVDDSLPEGSGRLKSVSPERDGHRLFRGRQQVLDRTVLLNNISRNRNGMTTAPPLPNARHAGAWLFFRGQAISCYWRCCGASAVLVHRGCWATQPPASRWKRRYTSFRRRGSRPRRRRVESYMATSAHGPQRLRLLAKSEEVVDAQAAFARRLVRGSSSRRNCRASCAARSIPGIWRQLPARRSNRQRQGCGCRQNICRNGAAANDLKTNYIVTQPATRRSASC